MTSIDEKQDAVQASIEYRQTEKAFDRVKEGLLSKLYTVNNAEGANRVAISLQVLEEVRNQLFMQAEHLKVIEAEEKMQQQGFKE